VVKVAKAKVFIGFDYDNDRSLKDLLVGQAKNEDSPFEISDWSLKEAAPEKDWKEKAEEKIKRVDILCVIAGEKTHKASGVLKEIEIADNLNGEGYDIKKFQLIGYSDKECPHVEGAGRRIAWTWDNLKSYFKK
jgi:hypothetical protein